MPPPTYRSQHQKLQTWPVNREQPRSSGKQQGNEGFPAHRHFHPGNRKWRCRVGLGVCAIHAPTSAVARAGLLRVPSQTADEEPLVSAPANGQHQARQWTAAKMPASDSTHNGPGESGFLQEGGSCSLLQGSRCLGGYSASPSLRPAGVLRHQVSTASVPGRDTGTKGFPGTPRPSVSVLCRTQLWCSLPATPFPLSSN